MHSALGHLVDAVIAVDATLAEAGFDYAFGGALALSAWAEPRATRDLDVNIWVDPGDITPAIIALEAAGVAFDRGQAARDAEERGMFVGFHGDYRVDVFVPSIPFYEEARARIQRIDFLGRALPVLSAETLAVFKMLFFRPKDLVDLQRMLEIRGGEFDASFVRAALIEMMGVDDERIGEWDRIVDVAR